jgi:hypothetical protein
MRFHWPSFVLGYAAGLGSAALSKRLRPLLVELGAIAYRAVDAIAARAVMLREDVEDLLAEARARVRGADAIRFTETALH